MGWVRKNLPKAATGAFGEVLAPVMFPNALRRPRYGDLRDVSAQAHLRSSVRRRSETLESKASLSALNQTEKDDG